MVYNIFGFFLAPNISGYIMDQFEERIEGLIVGFRFILWENIFTILYLFLALYYSVKKNKKKEEKTIRFENELELADIGGSGDKNFMPLNDKVHNKL